MSKRIHGKIPGEISASIVIGILRVTSEIYGGIPEEIPGGIINDFLKVSFVEFSKESLKLA